MELQEKYERLRGHHKFVRDLLLHTQIELYELTPDKLEYEIRNDTWVTRESLLPGLRETVNDKEDKHFMGYGGE